MDAHKISSTLIILLIFSLYSSSIVCQTHDSLITEVENGLLPYVLIKGEPSFNLNDRMEYYKVPGISIAVIKDFQVEWSKQYGVLDSEIKNKVTEETIFNIGSLSKGVTALTVLSLVEEGKIDLDNNINDQLISWKIPENNFTELGTVTPLLLLNHSGGAIFMPGVVYSSENFPTNLQILKGEPPSKTKPVVIDKVPGTEFQYSNAGYSILQQLVTDIEGKSFPEVTSQKVFRPLKMSKSTFMQPLPQKLINIASAGHSANGEPTPNKRYYFPNMAAGGLWTTTIDYAKYVIELQKSYIGKSNKIISQDLTKKMLSSHIAKQYGLGVFMREMYGEINYFGHLGDSRGFFAGFVSHLTEGYGAVVFTNGKNGINLIREITNGIAKIYNWELYLPEEYEVVAINNNVDQYSGRFSIGSDALFEVKVEQNNLFIDHFDNAQLYHIGNGRFVTKLRLGYLQYEYDDENNITSVIYNFSDEVGRLPSSPITCFKMNSEQRLPIEFLEEGNTEQAAELYRKIKKENASDPYISENRLNALGYNFLGKEMYPQALTIMKLNVEFYPESGNCYDSIAEAYMKSGDKEQAVKYYKKALEVVPTNQNAIDMLEKLNADK